MRFCRSDDSVNQARDIVRAALWGLTCTYSCALSPGNQVTDRDLLMSVMGIWLFDTDLGTVTL
jgi:hypothetical protein